MALDFDFRSDTYDSFFSIAEIDVYIDRQKMFYSSDGGWSDLADVDKEPYILAATRWINLFNWKGTRNSEIVVLSMQWPRSGLEYVTGADIDSEVTPDAIGYAEACYILQILFGNISSGSSDAVLKRKKVGGVEVEYDTDKAVTVVSSTSSCILENVPSTWYDDTLAGARKMGAIGLGKLP